MPKPGAADPGARFARDLAQLIDPARDGLLVAVSGGADSLALLVLTHDALGGRCAAATVDHGIRPEAADEAAHVAAVCAQRGIDHVILRGDLPARADRTANLHARARALRYRLLDQERAARGLDWVATAHHADDQRETFVMRANRGAGVAGLAGIRRRVGPVVRPLLDWRRDELAAIVARAGIMAIVDPANSDDRFDRARLRARLADADWLDATRIARSADAMAAADDALAWAADRAFTAHVASTPGVRTVHPADLPAEIVRRILRRCAVELDPGCDADGPAFARFVEALARAETAMIGNVVARPHAGADGGARWELRPAPPRRSA